MRYSNSFGDTLRSFRRAPALIVFAGVAGLLLTAFAPAPSTSERAAPRDGQQFAQEKGKAKAKADAQPKAKAKADEDSAKGGATGQCPPGKTFTPGRGRGVGSAGHCS